jgi:Tfp pilus assembly protein PilO
MPVINRRQQLVSVLNQFYEKPVARVSVELIISISVIVFFAIFAIRPTLLTMTELIKEIEDKRTLDRALDQKIAALGSAQSEFLTLQDRLGVLDEAIPSQPDLVTSVKTIERIASDRNLPITAISVSDIPDDLPEDVPFEKLKRQNLIISLSVTGDYLAIRQFVEDIKSTRRMFVLESVTFSTGDELGTRMLKASLSVNVPYFGLDPKPVAP